MDYSLLLAIEKVEQTEEEEEDGGMEIIHENLEEDSIDKDAVEDLEDPEIEEFQRLKFNNTPQAPHD